MTFNTHFNTFTKLIINKISHRHYLRKCVVLLKFKNIFKMNNNILFRN